MEIKLSDHFTYKKLLRFVLPSIVMMVFTSIYDIRRRRIYVRYGRKRTCIKNAR